jgi:hypothetical protein
MAQKILYWLPRVIAILAILFMLVFSIDCFDGNTAMKEKFICFVMHNIPALIITAVLVIAWKWELIGGILFIAVALAGSIIFRGFSGNPGSLIVMAPFVLAGVLFILHQVLSAKNNS